MREPTKFGDKEGKKHNIMGINKTMASMTMEEMTKLMSFLTYKWALKVT